MTDENLSPHAKLVLCILVQAKDLGVNGNGCLSRDEIVAVASNCKLTSREIMNADHDTLVELFLPILPG